VQRVVCAPVGRREQPLARHPALCCASESLPRLGAHAPPAPAHGHGDEYRAGDRLAQGHPFRRALAEAGTLCAVGAASIVTPGSTVLRGLNQQSPFLPRSWMLCTARTAVREVSHRQRVSCMRVGREMVRVGAPKACDAPPRSLLGRVYPMPVARCRLLLIGLAPQRIPRLPHQSGGRTHGSQSSPPRACRLHSAPVNSRACPPSISTCVGTRGLLTWRAHTAVPASPAHGQAV
jgi:hypothetical protein